MSAAIIKKGATAAVEKHVPFDLPSVADPLVPVDGGAHTFVLGEVKIRPADGVEVNVALDHIVTIGHGVYAVILTDAQAALVGTGYIYADVGSTAQPFNDSYSVMDFSSVTAADIVAALMAYSHDTGATVKGLFRRLDALAAGKATGLRSGVATYFRRGGAAKAMRAVQDLLAGTRQEADISESEA